MKTEKPENEIDHILSYAKGTEERKGLLKEIEKIKKAAPIEIPLILNGEEVKTGDIENVRSPHHKDLILAKAHLAGEAEIKEGIESALAAHKQWSQLDWDKRVVIFKKAADMLAGPHRIHNIAAIMLNQSKNPYEAEIDLAELVDFWRFNSYYMAKIANTHPDQAPGELNRFDWRPLEGFILAIPPFNFYSIAGNLPTAPAIAGNVSIWKPSRSVIFSNYQIMKILLKAGLPKGVINFLPFSSKHADILLEHPEFAGLHFTGSYETLTLLWKTINQNVTQYENFPRIVGESGGKNFFFIHESAEIETVVNNLIRGSFGYQGQKCSASSRAYVPDSMWDDLKQRLLREVTKISFGPTEALSNYMGALIDESAFEKVVSYIDYAKKHSETYNFVYGGENDSSEGWFVEPTIIRASDPKSKLMKEEIFGPVVVMYVYPGEEYVDTLKLCESTSPYGLTGSIFAKDREAIDTAERILRFSAGNFYINYKPTAAIVNRQPFGGARASGTNDKAGSWLNLLRWLNLRSIREDTLFPEGWKRKFQQ
ncbi:MAG: L-glutamate gamma-semialdehyde dehydrogenase [Candidatus Korarchaeota archaeon]|nr:L-glutamate gamma-semialdehyde dehydrogenase [Candidatus Korarchaeota archaeon]NIU82410.1 L-glutamate gamma-semialdehyde dehydrogenase [Candidatus Thorarchaeota archaeon]NIW12883.1 L-glutamate gamma-semialdehyde dehydrogenase [Candidatus Thorarchaeota archaeon]NIW51077.1 L-glutamate gamma-semialdehyde dehydrogenase [Candidatus Korarchaeota archaeon]